MKQTARIISTYSADVMGVSSALFELGGMVVMHDASGCNSTYTTHDEPRWFDMDSMIYISGLSEIEAIMGDDEKLISDITDAANELHPAFVAIAGTPIPTMTGFDFEACAEVIEHRTGIPCFGFPTTGMNTYIHGASMAFEGIAERFVRDVDPSEMAFPAGVISSRSTGGKTQFFDKARVNILGLTPLDFSVNGTDRSLAGWLEENGFTTISRWAMGCSLEEIAESGKADVNLVVSAAGLGAAAVLYRRFGIPYVVGLPIGEGQSSALKEALNNAVFRSRAIRHSDDILKGGSVEFTVVKSDIEGEDVIIIGEGVTSLGLATAIELDTGRPARVLCATDCPEGILRAKDRMTPDEDDIMPELAHASVIIADPLYKPICPEDAEFISLPSEAFSGRIYRKDIPDLIACPDSLIGRL